MRPGTETSQLGCRNEGVAERLGVPVAKGTAVEKSVVLVVEDEPVIRMIAVEMLEDAGWSVVEFATADDAIAFCGRPENDIAAVFTDINMPGNADGLDLATLVAASRPKAAVVVTSGRYQEPPDGLAGRVRFLPKPWNVQDLLTAITGGDDIPDAFL